MPLPFPALASAVARDALAALVVLTAGATAAAAQTVPTAPPGGSASAPGSPAKTASDKGGGTDSAFQGYRRFADEPVGSWRAANDQVGRIGGWKTYAREAAAQDASEPVPPQPAPATSTQSPVPAAPAAAAASSPAAAPRKDAHGAHH